MNRNEMLPVWKTIGETYLFTLRHWWRLALMGLPVIALLTYLAWPLESPIFEGPIIIAPIDESISERVWRNIKWGLSSHAIFAVPAAVGLVAIHRLALLGDHGSYPALPFRLGKREVRFVLVLTVAAAPIMLYEAVGWGLAFAGDLEGIAPPAVLIPALLLGSTFTSWLSLRLSLGLPATAIDQRHPLRTGWNIGRGNNVRLIAVAALAMIPAVLVMAGTLYADILLSTFEPFDGPEGRISIRLTQPFAALAVLVVFQSIAVWSLAALEAAVLTFSFRALGGVGLAANGYALKPPDS